MDISSEAYQQFAELREQASMFRDKLGMPMDEGIIDLVAALRLHGINTTGSCAGHAERDTGGPYVMFQHSSVDTLTEKYFLLDDKTSNIARDLRSRIFALHAQEVKKVFDLLCAFYENRKVKYETCFTVRLLQFAGGRLDNNSSVYNSNVFGDTKRVDDVRTEMQDLVTFLCSRLKTSPETGEA